MLEYCSSLQLEILWGYCTYIPKSYTKSWRGVVRDLAVTKSVAVVASITNWYRLRTGRRSYSACLTACLRLLLNKKDTKCTSRKRPCGHLVRSNTWSRVEPSRTRYPRLRCSKTLHTFEIQNIWYSTIRKMFYFHRDIQFLQSQYGFLAKRCSSISLHSCTRVHGIAHGVHSYTSVPQYVLEVTVTVSRKRRKYRCFWLTEACKNIPNMRQQVSL